MSTLEEFLSENPTRLRPKLPDREIASVWEYVCQFIQQQLLADKGVCVANFGTFTFSRKSLHIGNGYLSIQRPVFNLSSQLMQSFHLVATNHHVSGSVQVVPLNFSAVAAESPYTRDVIQEVVDFISRELPRALHNKKKVELLVNGIGRLRINASDVKFRFFREFLNELDASGKVEQVFRLDTRGRVSNPSVLSRNQASTCKSRSTSTVVLPKLVSRGGNNLTSPVIVEDIQAEERGGAGDEGQTSLQEKIPPKEKRARRSPEGGGRSSSTSQADPSPEPCGHKNSGQELCYLCYQRASRNVPVNFDSEKREHDYVQNQILLEYQKHQQALHLARERARKARARSYAQETQQHNWEVACEKKEQKAARPTDFEASFLMRSRPLSPPDAALRTEYGQELKEQMKRKSREVKVNERERQIDERLEQIHLADQLATSEKAYREKKQREADEYSKSLKFQMEHKAEQVPPHEPDSEVFGKKDYYRERHENKVAAERIMKEQIALTELKKQQERKRIEEERQREREMLGRARDDLRTDLTRDTEIKQAVANDLVESWLAEKRRKKRRDLEEEKTRKEVGARLLEQCQDHSRCHQCQRDPHVGAGVTHVRKDGTFPAGFTAFS